MARYGPRQFLAELRRRRVFNTVLVYIVGAWVVLQAADLAFPGFDVPESALAYVWLGAILLLPLVLILGWKYDIHVTGIERTPPLHAAADYDRALQPGDRWLIGGLGSLTLAVVAVMLVLIARAEPDDIRAVPANSIAVMPFEWCADTVGDMALAGGIHAAVIDRLAARERLRVIGRNSVYAMAGAGLPPDRMTELFRVQYLLYGELCNDGVDLVLRAELTDRDAAIVWNGSFRQVVVRGDQVEQQLASLVANGIALELGEVATVDPHGPVNAHALELLRIAQHLHNQYHDDDGPPELAEKVRDLLEKALDYQPDFAQAIWEMASIQRDLGDAEWDEGYIERAAAAWPFAEEALALAREEIRHGTADYKAYALAGNILRIMSRWEEQLIWRQSAELNNAEFAARETAADQMLLEAEGYLRDAIRHNPSDASLRTDLVSILERQGAARRGEVLDILEQARRTEPFDENIAVKLARNLALRGQYERAIEELERFGALGEISNDLRWWQLEIQADYDADDDRLALLLDMLQNEPDKFTRVRGGLPHLFWVSSDMCWLGLDQEAETLHDKLVAIPERADATDWEKWARQFFLLDRYCVELGQDDGEQAREMLAEAEGLTNTEILDRWILKASEIASTFWTVGERERSIELFEALRNSRQDIRWPQRAPQLRVELAWRYLAEGREAEAAPVLEELADLLEAELAAGVRHPMTLDMLAHAYAWQGHPEEALEMKAMAVDYGFDGDGKHWPDWVDTYYDGTWSLGWEALKDDPRYQELLRRQEAAVERKAANIRALLASHDIDRLLAPVIEVHAASYELEQSNR
jgi:TolB-like protein